MGWIESLMLCVPLSGFLWSMAVSGLGFTVPTVPLDGGQEERSPTPTQAPKVSPQSPPTVAKPRTFSTFNSQPLDQQIKLYLRYLKEVGTPDILIVGSSRAYQGVDPLVLQNTLIKRGYSDVKVFNLGVNGATAQVVDLILRRLLTQEQLPRLILWADGARAFNSGRNDLTLARITASPGYAQLIAGIRPQIAPTEVTELKPFCIKLSSGFPVSDLAVFQTSADRSSNLTKAKTQQFCLQPAVSAPSFVVKTVPLGVDASPTSAELGFNTVSTRFDPDRYFRRYPNVPGSFDGDYRNFTLQGNQTLAFRNTLRFARSRGIPIVFVSLPLTQTYLDPVRAESEQMFRNFLMQFAYEGKLTFHDMSRRWSDQNGYFADPSHLNRYGAAVVATHIGKVIPLPGATDR